MNGLKILFMICIVFLISGCIPKAKITDEWIEENINTSNCIYKDGKTYCKLKNKCVIDINRINEITEEMIEECCDENSCFFESPEYGVIPKWE